MELSQKVFLGAAALVVFYHSFRGWRMGPVRQLIGVLALLAAYLDAYYFSPATVPLLRPLGLPNFVLQAMGGLVLGLVTYVVVATLGGILFKKTSDQTSTLVWFLYGVTGSFIGLVLGFAMVLIAAVGVRLLGTLADGANLKAASGETQPAATPRPADWLRNWPGKHPSENSGAGSDAQPKRSPGANSPGTAAAVSGLVQLKRSLSEGVVGEVLQTVDPISRETYETLEKIGKLSSKPDAIARFLAYPGARELVGDPEITALRDDAQVAQEIQKQDLMALIRNPKVVKICNSPKTAAKLKKFDLRKALDYALAQ